MTLTHGQDTDVPVAMLSYSTRPRGGVVHTLALSERLHDAGWPVHLYVLGDPAEGLYRPTTVPHTVFPAAPRHPRLVDRVFAAIDAMETGLADALPPGPAILHAQDCIASRAATRIRAERSGTVLLRTVHHVDDFKTPELVDCQLSSIHEPDHLLTVSSYWQDRLRDEYGVLARQVSNGVDVDRFSTASEVDPADLRASHGADGRTLFLTVGGLEPRKGGLELVEAFAMARNSTTPTPRLVVVGGQSFQDHADYRQRCMRRIDELGLSEDIVLVGTVSDAELNAWYQAADVFVLPSTNEGWGLVVLEAMASKLPVIVSDLPVFREYLSPADAEIVPVHDPDALAAAMCGLSADPAWRHRLAGRGPDVAARFTWEASAREHMEAYREYAPVESPSMSP